MLTMFNVITVLFIVGFAFTLITSVPIVNVIKNFWRGVTAKPYSAATTRTPFTERKPWERGFSEHYQKRILPHLQELEDLRVQQLAIFIKRSKVFFVSTLSFILLIVALLSGSDFSSSNIERSNLGSVAIITNLGLILIFAIGVWGYLPVIIYRKKSTFSLLPEVIRFYMDSFTFKPKGSISMQSLLASNIIPSCNHYVSEDYIKGTHKDVTIELSETNLQRKKIARKSTVFHGVFILLSVNKPFKGKTIILKDKGRIQQFLVAQLKKKEQIHLEDPVFESKFDVYSDDQVEARYLLTTSFMERLVRLSQIFDNSAIQCSFFENKLLITIPQNKNMFEVGSLFVSTFHTEWISILLEEIHLVLETIEELKLNQNIGL